MPEQRPTIASVDGVSAEGHGQAEAFLGLRLGRDLTAPWNSGFI